MVLVGLLPLTLSLGLAYREERQALRETTGSNFKGIAVEVARKIETQILRGINEAQQLATIPFIRTAVKNANRSYEGREPDSIRAFIEEWEARWRSRTNPREFPAFVNRIATKYLVDWHAVRKSDYLGIVVTDSQGALVLSSLPQVKFYYGDSEWWASALHQGRGQIYVSDLTFEPSFGTHVLNVVVPIVDHNPRRTLGTVSIMLRRDSLFRSISEVTAGVTGHAMLMDTAGVPLICPVLSLEQHTVPPAMVAAVNGDQAGWVQVNRDTHGARDSLVGYAHLRIQETLAPESFRGRQWLTIVRQNPEETYAPLRHLLVKIAMYGVVVFGILWLAGLVVARKIMSPIQTLHEGVKRIGSGNLEYPLVVKTGDEIETLAEAFNTMQRQIDRHTVQLKQEVAAQTKQLSESEKRLQRHSEELEAKVRDRTREIRETQTYLESLLENANDVIYTLDHDQCFTYVNGKVENWGYRKEDLLGRPFLSLVAKRQRGRRLKDILEMKVKQEYEVEVISRTGGLRSVLVSVSPLDNERHGVLGIARDITDRKLMEQQFRNTERLVSVGKLAAGVAHEINNPLGGILNCLHNMRKGMLSAERQEKYFMDMEDGLRRAQKIIRQLLDFSQQRDPEFSMNDLNGLVGRVLALTNHVIDRKGLRLREIAENSLPPLFVDPQMIEQVLTNLILNAVQATEAGGSITLRTRTVNGHCEIDVADTGAGIPPEARPHIFDPFFTTKGTGEGTGLGLSVSLGIVERHGGKLTVESEVGKGTVFTVSLPLSANRAAMEKVSG